MGEFQFSRPPPSAKSQFSKKDEEEEEEEKEEEDNDNAHRHLQNLNFQTGFFSQFYFLLLKKLL